MQYELVIDPRNVRPHIDIEQDIQTKKGGLFTFTIRVNNGYIVDYSSVEYVNATRDYPNLKKYFTEELTISRYSSERSE